MDEIAGYRIIRQIGVGGMGVVYEAEQLNPKRIVALKLLRADLISPRLSRRLQFEAQVLGHLEHPGIAHIHEAGWVGSDPHARPYIAMEYVRGQPLNDYVQTRNLSISETLTLVVKVCEAIEHAHQKGIIHRDLKPENILVMENGQPKILDFGLARATNGDLLTLSTCRDMDEVLGTILYMSPEQAQGQSEEIDSRSDVYSLGVIAYELLTGEFPYPHKGKSLVDYVCALYEEDPRPAKSLDKTLQGDIDTILSKALMREKSHRYQSASEMAEDIGRYLEDRPIVARPVSAIYQLQKFSRRNKALVAGVCATMIALVIGLLGTMSQARIAAVRAYEAEAARAESDQLRENAETEQYAANISLANLACSQNRILEAEASLLKAPSRLRNWEWGYLWRKSHKELAVLRGHGKGIRDVAYNPQGTRLLSVSDDTTARIWEPNEARCLAVLEGHHQRLLFGQFSPDGQLIATASDDHTARVWTADGKLRFILAAHTGPVNKARFSPNGKRILTISDDATARIWDADTGNPLAILKGHGAPIYDGSFDPSGNLVATASDDSTIGIWSNTGDPITVLRGHRGAVNAIKFHPTGDYLVSVSDDGTARIWNTRTLERNAATQGREVTTPDMPSPRWVEFTPDGSQFYVFAKSGRVSLWDVATCNLVAESLQFTTEIEGAALSASGKNLALASKNFDALLCPLDPGSPFPPELVTYRGHLNYVTCAAFRPNASAFATGSADGTVRVWPVGPPTDSERGIAVDGSFLSAEFSGDRRLLAVNGPSKWMVVDPLTLSPIVEVDEPSVSYVAGDIKSDGSEVVTISRDAQMKFWRLPEGTIRKSVTISADILKSVEFSADGESVCAAGPESTATLWRCNDGARIKTFSGHSSEVFQAVFTQDGKGIVTISADRTMKLWSIESGEVLLSKEFPSIPSSICISPVDNKFAIATSDLQVSVWSADEMKELTSFSTGHLGDGLELALSPDGTRLITATTDKVAKIWNTNKFNEITSFTKDAGRIFSIQFSRDGRLIALALEKSQVIIMDCGPGKFSMPPFKDLTRN